MKVHLFLYLMGIIKDIRNATSNHSILNNKSSKFLNYNSELIGKMELSGEMIYEIFNNGGDLDILFDKKKLFVFVLELVRLGFKFNELQYLCDSGFNFYFSKKIYFEQVLNMSDEDYFAKLEEVK